MFALFMDYVIFPIYWLASPSMRKHQRNVRTQNAHLDGSVHVVPDPNCWYCKAREADRQQRSAP